MLHILDRYEPKPTDGPIRPEPFRTLLSMTIGVLSNFLSISFATYNFFRIEFELLLPKTVESGGRNIQN